MLIESLRSTFGSIAFDTYDLNRILRQILLNVLTLKQGFKPFLASESRIQGVSWLALPELPMLALKIYPERKNGSLKIGL